MQDVRKARFLIAALTAAVLLPFLNKAFHIDDPLFLWVARQITTHPLDPYGFSVNWETSSQPVWQQMQNPPLCSYYIAAVASVIGWSEPALHVAFLPWAVLSILGTYVLARRFCREPFAAALLTLFTPVFLVSATNVMCDVMLLAFWLWSIEFWLAGLQREKWYWLLLSASFATAATLTKYFGFSVVLLLGVYTIARNHRRAGALAFFAIPIFALAAFQVWTKASYGTSLVTSAISVSRTLAGFQRWSWFAQFLTGLAFTGGSLIGALFYLPIRQWRLSTFAAAGGIALFYFFVPLGPIYALGNNMGLVRVEGGIFAAIGAGILALSLRDLLRAHDFDSLFLALWVIGTFSFSTFFNWSVTARTILPLAPAAAILLVRRREEMQARGDRLLSRYWGVGGALIISLSVAAADYFQANTGRAAAREFKGRFHSESGTVWFESHWGFQYYMERWSAVIVNAANSEIVSGDLLVLPYNHGAVVPLPLERMDLIQTLSFWTVPVVSTLGRGTGAAFYSSTRGPLPWAIDYAQPETYFAFRFR